MERSSGEVVRIVGVCVEITACRAIEAELALAVIVDPLTGTMNRRGLERSVAAAIDRGLVATEAFGIALIDVDEFKSINETYGHRIGDAVLRHVANVLQAAILEGETVSRIGGDEFAVLLRVSSRDEFHRRLAILRQLMDCDVLLVDRTIRVRASLGGAIWKQPWTLDDILAASDNEMYRHKT
ncbi:GGDEF domain-containing protein [Aureimonas sp. N4]|uniref:GGDEF domain-containing protein n=1 Tax=Aureimonas sp. N4 TaxID=1638165 RepID=UPI0007832FB1|nr:GGDEF domain-containing protein [Aureimonas sp. N4]